MTTDPTEKHREEVRYVRADTVREVLEGLSRMLHYTHGQAERCWCPDPNSNWTHTPACLATRALYEKLQPAKESSDGA